METKIAKAIERASRMRTGKHVADYGVARGEPPAGVEYHNERLQPYARLPFIGVERVAFAGAGQKNETQWSVPATGGWVGGRVTGDAMGFAYFKFRTLDSRANCGLEEIALAFFARLIAEGGIDHLDEHEFLQPSEELASIRGQMHGFFEMIEHWISVAALEHAEVFDAINESAIVEQANAGLGCTKDPNAYATYVDIVSGCTQKDERNRVRFCNLLLSFADLDDYPRRAEFIAAYSASGTEDDRSDEAKALAQAHLLKRSDIDFCRDPETLFPEGAGEIVADQAALNRQAHA